MRKILISVLTAAALSACGGGNDSSPETAQVPESASQSALGFVSYLKHLVVSSDDMLEAVDISAVAPRESDSTESESVD